MRHFLLYEEGCSIADNDALREFTTAENGTKVPMRTLTGYNLAVFQVFRSLTRVGYFPPLRVVHDPEKVIL